MPQAQPGLGRRVRGDHVYVADSERQRRVAENETIFRAGNEAIRRAGEKAGATQIGFLCECGDEECFDVVDLTSDEYRHVRAHPARFVVMSGHDIPEVENVVEHDAGHAIVEKTGIGGEIARQRH